MKLFIDTANLDQIRDIAAWGILDGCTTNPSLAAREGRNFAELIAEICEVVDGPVSAEVVAEDAEGMLKEARLLAQIHDNVVVKVPIGEEGIKATRILTDEGIRTNVTLIFSVTQAFMAAKAGATYVSPFIGRVDDAGGSGIGLVADIVDVFDTYAFDTEVLAASIRSVQHMTECLRVGAHVATIPTSIFRKMLVHPQTDIGMAGFMADWARSPDGGDVVKVVSGFLDARKG